MPGRVDAFDLGDLLGELVEWHDRGLVGGDGDDRLATGERGVHRRVTEPHVVLSLDDVAHDGGCPGFGDAEVVARRARTTREWVVGGRSESGTVEHRRPGDEVQVFVGDRANGDFVGRDVAGIVHLQDHADSITLLRRAGRIEPLGQGEGASDTLRHDALHVDGQRGDGSLGHRCGQAVDEEQDAAEQADSERDAQHRGQRPARVSGEICEDVSS